MSVPDDDQRSIGWGAFRSKTGRNQPQAKDFVLLRNAWWRTMITPPPGKALLYCDWASQEIAIAAYLSGDPAMVEHYRSGDFYLHFAKSPTAQLVPPDATKATHGGYRNMVLKPTCLGTIYGMREYTLALRLGCSITEARRLLRAHRDTYHAFWTWVEDRVAATSLVGHIDTPLGWRMRIGDLGRSGDGPWITGETTIQNWSMQAAGGDVLRVACIALAEAGIRVSFPLHDAVAVECDLVEVEEVSRIVSRLMERAAETVLGAPIPVEVDVIRPGANLRRGDKADAMWKVVQSALPQRDWAGEKLCLAQ
jgi:DNA polymerase I-like protein with 3'-5' exonuclease and polymerase domains